MKNKDSDYEEIIIADNKKDAQIIAKKSNPNSKILNVIWTYK